MTYTIAKQNIGTPRVFTTTSRFQSAVIRAGANEVYVHHEGGNSYVEVTWPEGKVRYAMDPDGNVDPQLAWDMEP